jgi:uncharacterized protein
MRSLRILAVLLLFIGAGEGVRADEVPSTEATAAANELFTILSTDLIKQLSGQVTNAFWPVVEQRARADKIDDATIAALRAEFERIQIGFVADAMKDAPPIYARHFTVGELHDLIAFYRTPTGTKALQQMPQVMGEFAMLLVPRMQDLQRQATDSFNRILQEHGYGK